MGPKKSSFYAVKCGKLPGVYNTWAECQANVAGFSGAVYKKFDCLEEAERFSMTQSISERSKFFDSCDLKQRSQNGDRNISSATIDEPDRDSSAKGVKITPLVGKRSHSGDDIDQRYKQAKVAHSPHEYSRKKITVVYTDGASSNNGQSHARAGYGVYWGDNDPRNASVRLSGRQTNQRAEASAVIHALEQSQDGVELLEIMTDSQYVIKAVTEWSKNWVKRNWKTSKGSLVENKDLFKRILSLIDSRKGKVNFTYVPGHKGVEGNEKADQLAVAGAQMNL